MPYTQALPYRRPTGLVRMVQRRPDLNTLIRRVHNLMKDYPALGPIGLARDAMRTVGWRWEHTWRAVAGPSTQYLTTVQPDSWAHEVRATLRHEMWRTDAARWTDTDRAGLENGMDTKATMVGSTLPQA